MKRKQIEFIKAYTTPNQPGFQNASASARIAGYSATSSGSGGAQLLKNPQIASEIDKASKLRAQELSALSDITKEEYLQITRGALDQVGVKHANFTKLLEIIAKVKGFFNETASTQIMIYNESPDDREESSSSLLHRFSKLSKASIKSSNNPA